MPSASSLAVSASLSESELLALEARRCQATIAGDVTALDTLFEPAFLYVHATGHADDKRSYLDRIESGALRYTKMASRPIRVVIGADVALLHAEMAVTASLGGRVIKSSSHALATWVPDADGAWRLIGFHAAQLPQSTRGGD